MSILQILFFLYVSLNTTVVMLFLLLGKKIEKEEQKCEKSDFNHNHNYHRLYVSSLCKQKKRSRI